MGSRLIDIARNRALSASDYLRQRLSWKLWNRIEYAQANHSLFNYGELGYTVNSTTYPGVVSFAKSHGFTSLMIVIYADHHSRFNNAVLHSFYTYAKSQNVTFVPSYYIESINDSMSVNTFLLFRLQCHSAKKLCSIPKC
jgi:hypothetical protein